MTFHLIYLRARSEGFAFLSASSSDTPNARGRSAEGYVSYGRAQNAPPPNDESPTDWPLGLFCISIGPTLDRPVESLVAVYWTPGGASVGMTVVVPLAPVGDSRTHSAYSTAVTVSPNR